MSLAGQRIEDKTVLPEAKRLMRYLIAWHMGGKPLKTRELFKQQL
jgi:recombinational DNA repair protein (RecF pathway)